MFRSVLTILFISGLFLPHYSFAEQLQGLQEERCKKISQLGEKIVSSEFEPITITVNAPTLEKALAEVAIAAREHIDKYDVSPMLCKCLEAVAFIPEQERALLRVWGGNVEFSGEDEERVTIVMDLDRAKLIQLALFNIWPLQFKNFNA